MRNLTLALRMLRKTPFVTAIAVASLALGIGANAAIFSLFDQMLLSALPVPEAARLVNLGAPGPKQGSTSCNQAGSCELVFSYPMFRDLEREQKVLTGLAAHQSFGVNLAIKNQPVATSGMFVSGSYFPTLQLRPAVGRLLTPEDDKTIAQHFVTVISYDLWQERFGGDPTVVNQTLVVNGQLMTIVGVAPRDFEGTTLGTRPQVYVPITMRGVMLNRTVDFTNRRNYYLYLFGRLKPGVTLDQAKTSLNAIYTPIVNDIEASLQQGMSATTMKAFKARKIDVEAGARGQSSIHREASTPLYMLFGITGIVLLIACANIANLLLARGATRSTEMGVRLALGASRRQLISQLLTESIVLALLGGIASIVVAKWTLSGIGTMLPPDANDSLKLELQPSVVLFAAAVSVATGVIFGLFPALHSTRTNLISSIRAGAGQVTGGGKGASRFRGSLVTVQIALAMALLTSAGLFLKSLVNVSKVNLGADIEHVVTFSISPRRSGYDSTRTALLYDRLEQEIAAVPGVTGITSSMVPLLAGSNWGTDVRVQGFQSGPDIDSNSRYNEVGASYFSLLGMRLLDGREFTPSDRAGTTKVAIVNQAFAKKFKLGKDAVGKFMSLNGNDSLNLQIVGLAQDAKYSDVKDEVPPVAFIPWRQDTDVASLSFYVKTTLPPAQILRTIPEVMHRLDPIIPVEDLKTMPQQVRERVFMERMISTLSAAFAVLATLLATVGLYGVLAYNVAQRTREIGVRMALGADARRVRALVMRQMGVMVITGGVVGVIAAYLLGKAARSLLYGMEGHDPLVFALSIILLSLIAMAAGYVPARRAVLVDPMNALRYD